MKKPQSSRSKAKTNSNTNENKLESKRNLSTGEAILKEWRNEASLLSYEESLKELELLLQELQNDTLPVEDLQRHYLRGNIYLNHCESLLQNIEQEVIQLNPEDLL